MESLIVREQFGNACSKELSVYLMERKPQTLDELAKLAEQYLQAHNKKLSARDVVPRRDLSKPKESGRPSFNNDLKCFACHGYGHKAADCRRRPPRNYVSLRSSNSAPGRDRPATHSAGCAVPLRTKWEEANGAQLNQNSAHGSRDNIDDGEWLELKNGERVRVLNAACLENVEENQMPVVTGVVGGKAVQVLRDTGCSGVIIKKSLVEESQFTEEVGYIMTIDRRAMKVPTATIEIDTPYYSGMVEAMCLENPLYDLIIGNLPDARDPNDANEKWCVPVAVVTRAQARKETQQPQPLIVAKGANNLSITKEELIRLQEEDESLAKFKGIEEIVRNGFGVGYEKKGGVLYRMRRRVDGEEAPNKQILVPKNLRRKVMEIAHDSIFGGHMGVKKTEDCILSNFYWPGMHQDVASYCRSCDVCQKTVSKGSVSRVPLGKTPLIDMPFKRVAIDLIGPIIPSSDKGHRYILTLVDYATRYPEAVPLKNIDTETVAEALLDLYSRVGIPEEVLSDLGTQLVSECMQEVSRMLSIRRLTTTPYHPICNGLSEKFNGTLKKMLRRLCANQPRQWYRFINPLLFAYGEVPQESTGFSPFELLYGRTVRGPMKILKELWAGEDEGTEVQTSYQYVFELRERLEETMKLAQSELRKSQSRYKHYYDKKAKERCFKEGDKVLTMLPTNNNKLLMQWKGPYKVAKKLGENDYQISVSNKLKTYHANMLKLYHGRSAAEGESQAVGATAVASLREEELPSVDDESLLELGVHHQKEDVNDVKIGHELTEEQSEQLRDLLGNFAEVFSDVPGKTDVIEHKIELSDDEPVSSRPYHLSYAVRQDLKEEIDDMLKLGIIRPSTSPYASPIVIVKKKDGSNRICVDYRKLNKLTVSDPEPMKTAEDLFQKLGQSKYFSKIDLSKGYWQVPVKESDVLKTAFVTPDGQYEFMRMPFGMKNSGATLVRGLRTVLAKLDGVESYIDDLLVYSDTWDAHLCTLNELLRRLGDANLTAKPSKCTFGSTSIEFLGHDIGFDWIKPNHDNLSKIEDARHPTTKKEVRSFFGLLNYYRDFIPSFATIAAPLSDLTKKGMPNRVSWGEVQEKAFVTLQKALLSRPILKLPDYSKPFVLETDASNVGVGASLMQKYEDKLHPIAFASKKLTAAERKYSTLEKECLAIVWAVKKYKLFLAGTKFVLQTDHKPLSYLNSAKFQNDRIMRWSLSLQDYDYRVEDIPGKDNHLADYMSRVM